MNYIFTVCSNNYLAQAGVLGKSVKKHEPTSTYLIFLCDKKDHRIDYSIMADEVIEIAAIEPELNDLALKYNVIELNTAVKPMVAQYLFKEIGAQKVLYLDPDIRLYNDLSTIYHVLESCSIVLSPHIYTPIPIDGKRPDESTFLNYGIYNLGFIGLKNDEETHSFLSWWKHRTYNEGYSNAENGIFVDQLPINHAPIFFKHVHVLEDFGVNMAPWNLHERFLSKKDGKYMVNGDVDLTFYHFSSINVEQLELSLMHYGRFNLPEREDLLELYQDYQKELISHQHQFLKTLVPYYTQMREAVLKDEHKRKWYHRLLSRSEK